MTAMAGSSGQHRLKSGEYEIRRSWYGFGACLSCADRLSGRGGVGLLRLLDLLDQFQLDGDRDRVADQPAASLERHVPVQVPVLAVDLGLRIEAGAGRTPGCLDLPGVLDREHHRLGDVTDGQVAVELAVGFVEKLDAAALEGNI